MRLLLFSDLHCNITAAERLVEMSQEVDMVIGAGDFSRNHRGLEETIDFLARIEVPTILVPGNSETFEELDEACKIWPTATVLHGSGIGMKGLKFWGVGGAIPATTWSSSYDFSEDEGRKLLAGCQPGSILISHSPPKGLADKTSQGHQGSLAVREAVEQVQPTLVVCGHIHDCAGKAETMGSTRVINAGPRGILWDLSPLA